MTNEEKENLLSIRLDKAEESYKIAEELFEEHPTFAINRYYYSLYYAISGVLLSADSVIKVTIQGGKRSIFNKSRIFWGDFI